MFGNPCYKYIIQEVFSFFFFCNSNCLVWRWTMPEHYRASQIPLILDMGLGYFIAYHRQINQIDTHLDNHWTSRCEKIVERRRIPWGKTWGQHVKLTHSTDSKLSWSCEAAMLSTVAKLPAFTLQTVNSDISYWGYLESSTRKQN